MSSESEPVELDDDTKIIWNCLAPLTRDPEILQSISELVLEEGIEPGDLSSSVRVLLQELLPSLSEVRLDETVHLLEAKVKKIREDANRDSDDELEQLESVERDGMCKLCGANQRITIHHMVPKLVLKRMRKGKARVDGQKKVDVSIYLVEVCRPCHNELHRLWGHGELARELMTVDRILDAPELQPWLQYKRKRERNLEYDQ